MYSFTSELKVGERRRSLKKKSKITATSYMLRKISLWNLPVWPRTVYQPR